MVETVNCKNEECGALVYVTDVPSKKTGFCWRCEVKRLKAELKEMTAERDRNSSVLQKTIARLKVMLFYFDNVWVRRAVESWLEDSDDGIDLLKPPPVVDELLSKLEKIR